MISKVIICVDDERIILDGLHSQLSREFGSYIQIELTESAEEALELIEELKDEGKIIPIVITDQLMPGMKGSELLTVLSEVLPGTCNILLTGQADADAVGDAVNNGNLYRYISKPWDSADMTLTVREALKTFEQGLKLQAQNEILKKYNEELELMVKEQTEELRAEKLKSDKLLENILPHMVAEELKETGTASSTHFDQVTVMFTDFQGFTKTAQKIPPKDLIRELNECFTQFDSIIDKYNLEKIKTIGDAYMCAGGVPVANTTNPLDTVSAALEMINWIDQWNQKREKSNKTEWHMRIGVHTGEVVAGVVGSKKFQYDLWGDAVNVASRMEYSGEVGKVNISATTFESVKHRFECEYRGEIEAKNRGMIGMYFVKSKRDLV